MIREVIRPKHTNITINIPRNYIGREIEYIIFPLEEKENDEAIVHKSEKTLRGVFNQYADKSKLALENTAWQNYIIGEYKEND